MAYQSDKEYIQDLLSCIPELVSRSKDPTRATNALMRWLSPRITYSSQKLLLNHDNVPLHVLASKLLEHHQGVWCAGAALLLAKTLRALDMTALFYDFGIRSFGLSHAITLVMGYRQQVFAFDLYTNSVLVDAGGSPTDFVKVLADIARFGEVAASWSGKAKRTVLISKQEVLEKYSSYTQNQSPKMENDELWYFDDGQICFDSIFPKGHKKRYQLDVLAAQWRLDSAEKAFMRLMLYDPYISPTTSEGIMLARLFQEVTCHG